jgi:hypothetical protein
MADEIDVTSLRRLFARQTGVLRVMVIWTKPLARRTLSRAFALLVVAHIFL